MQELHHVHREFPGGAQAVDGDHPGVADTGHEPGGQRAQLAGHVHVGVVEAERGARVADVQVRGEPDPVAGPQGAVGDVFEAAYDRVGGVGRVLQDRADDRVRAVMRPVRTFPVAGRPGHG